MSKPEWFMDVENEVERQRRFIRENERIEARLESNRPCTVLIRVQSVVFDGESTRIKSKDRVFCIDALNQSVDIQSAVGEGIRRMVYDNRNEAIDE